MLATGVGVLAQKRRSFLKVEMQLVVLGGMSVVVLMLSHTLYRIYLRDYGISTEWLLRPLHQWALWMLLLPFGVGYLSGVEFALLWKKVSNHSSLKTTSGIMLASYHLGALLGTFFFAWIKHNGGPAYVIALYAAAGNLLLVILISKKNLKIQQFFLMVLFAFLVLLSRPAHSLYLKNLYYNDHSWTFDDQEGFQWVGAVPLFELMPKMRLMPQVRRQYGAYQTLDLVPDPAVKNNFSLYLNGHYQFDSDREADYHDALLKPLQFHKLREAHALIIGGGDGLLAKRLVEQKEIQQITLVEIDQNVIDLAHLPPLVELNSSALASEKINLVLDDAMEWLQTNRSLYDVIFVDLPYPYGSDGLRLYSLEFFRLVHDTLSEHGFVVMDAPVNFDNSQDPVNTTIFSTLVASGFKNPTPYFSKYDSFVYATQNFRASSRSNETGKLLTSSQIPTMTSEVNSVFKPRYMDLKDPSL